MPDDGLPPSGTRAAALNGMTKLGPNRYRIDIWKAANIKTKTALPWYKKTKLCSGSHRKLTQICCYSYISVCKDKSQTNSHYRKTAQHDANLCIVNNQLTFTAMCHVGFLSAGLGHDISWAQNMMGNPQDGLSPAGPDASVAFENIGCLA